MSTEVNQNEENINETATPGTGETEQGTGSEQSTEQPAAEQESGAPTEEAPGQDGAEEPVGESEEDETSEIGEAVDQTFQEMNNIVEQQTNIGSDEPGLGDGSEQPEVSDDQQTEEPTSQESTVTEEPGTEEEQEPITNEDETEEPPVETPPTEEPPVETPPTEEPPVETPPTAPNDGENPYFREHMPSASRPEQFMAIREKLREVNNYNSYVSGRHLKNENYGENELREFYREFVAEQAMNSAIDYEIVGMLNEYFGGI